MNGPGRLQAHLTESANDLQFDAADPRALLVKQLGPASTAIARRRSGATPWHHFEVISHFLVATAREFHGKKPGPTAGVIDSQTIKTTESGGISGYDAGKKTKGRKRHIVTDTLGFMVGLVVHSAGIQDRDGAPEVLKSIRYSHPNLRHIFADGGYAGPKLRDALEGIGDWTIQIVKRFDTAEGFEVIPRRWVVERTFAWLNRCRRLAKDWEKSIASSQAWILVAHIRTLTRKIARHCNHA